MLLVANHQLAALCKLSRLVRLFPQHWGNYTLDR